MLLGLSHIGIRVHDFDRALAFYSHLGFERIAGPLGPEPVAILEHPSGVEINLIINAHDAEPSVPEDRRVSVGIDRDDLLRRRATRPPSPGRTASAPVSCRTDGSRTTRTG